MNLFDKQPAIAADVFVAPNASVIGNVELSPKANVWFGSVLRGDVNAIKVGEQATIGDRAVVHVASGNAPGTQARPTTIGKGAVVGACALPAAGLPRLTLPSPQARGRSCTRARSRTRSVL